MSRRSTECLIEIGVIGRPHGVRGEVKVFLHNPQSELLAQLETVFLGGCGDSPALHRISSVRGAGRQLIVGFAETENRTDASALCGVKMFTERSQLPPLEPDEVYIADLIGCEVICDGKLLGRITASREQGGIDVFEVTSDFEEIQIPFVDQYISAIDIAGGCIEVRDVDELPRTKITPGRKG